MKLIHVYHSAEKPANITSTPWFTYANHIYFKSIFLIKSISSKSVLDEWIKRGELVQIGKPI